MYFVSAVDPAGAVGLEPRVEFNHLKISSRIFANSTWKTDFQSPLPKGRIYSELNVPDLHQTRAPSLKLFLPSFYPASLFKPKFQKQNLKHSLWHKVLTLWVFVWGVPLCDVFLPFIGPKSFPFLVLFWFARRICGKTWLCFQQKEQSPKSQCCVGRQYRKAVGPAETGWFSSAPWEPSFEAGVESADSVETPSLLFSRSRRVKRWSMRGLCNGWRRLTSFEHKNALQIRWQYFLWFCLIF